MNCITKNIKILLSTAKPNGENTTFGYGMAQLSSLDELMQVMNRKAVATGIYQGGHRNGSHLKAMGNVYFIDIDSEPQAGKAPYYQTIEAKLRSLNISFVSVPSKSADQYLYKRHIAIILDGNLPKQKDLFIEAANYILETIGIDVKKVNKEVVGNDAGKIDESVAFDRVRLLNPASINRHFGNYDDRSYFYDGEALSMPEHLKAVYDDAVHDDGEITTSQLISFEDGSTVSFYNAKQFIPKGTKKICHCPNPHHEDKHPSAAFFHNSDGTAIINCSKCGRINISTNFIPTVPSITHDQYNYSIILNNAPQANISTLVSKIGDYSYQTDTSVIWAYSVSSMDDIYQLILAKAYLVKNSFDVSYEPAPQMYLNLLSIATLQPITKNVTLPKPFIRNEDKGNPNKLMYIEVKTLIRKHYLFPEIAIRAYSQNILAPDRSFNDTCNKGLAYFDYVLKTQRDQQSYKQSDKYFPMNLSDKAKTASNKKRLNQMKYTRKTKTTANEKKVLKLMHNKKFVKANGEPNITAMAKKLNKSRPTIYAAIDAIKLKGF